MISLGLLTASSLSLDDRLVDLASRDIILPCEGDTQVPLVVSEIKLQ